MWRGNIAKVVRTQINCVPLHVSTISIMFHSTAHADGPDALDGLALRDSTT